MLKNITLKVEVLFVIIGLFWGLILLFINPPFTPPDEDDHLFKMWGYLEGSFNFKIINGKKGQIIPYNLAYLSDKFYLMRFSLDEKTTKEEILSLKNVPLNKQIKVFYHQTPTSYTIFSYIPAIFILAILKFLNTPPLFMVYILRFCCLLTYLAIMYQAIKLTPVHKWLFFVLALLPTNLYIASAINTDCLVISLGFLLIAYTLYLKFSDKVNLISKKQLLIFGILYTFICILKYLYFPLILLMFMLPKEKFETDKILKKYFTAFFFISFIYIFIYLILTTVLSTYAADYYHDDAMSTVSMIKHIFSHPLQYLYGIIVTPIASIYPFLRSLIAHFGWKRFYLNNYALVAFYILIFSCLFYEAKDVSFKIKDKIIMAATSYLCYTIIMTSVSVLYHSFPIMVGFQGRYAGPFIVLIFLLFASNKIRLQHKIVPYFVIASMQILYLYSCVVILQRFLL